MEERHQLEAQPGYKLAIPLFLFTSLPYFGTLLYDYIHCCGHVDNTFAWFGGFYVMLGGIYVLAKILKKGKHEKVVSVWPIQNLIVKLVSSLEAKGFHED